MLAKRTLHIDAERTLLNIKFIFRSMFYYALSKCERAVNEQIKLVGVLSILKALAKIRCQKVQLIVFFLGEAQVNPNTSSLVI